MSSDFRRLFFWVLGTQVLLWAIYIIDTYHSGHGDLFAKGMFALYGGWLANWLCEHFVQNIEANIGAGFMLFFGVAPVFVVLNSFGVAAYMFWVQGMKTSTRRIFGVTLLGISTALALALYLSDTPLVTSFPVGCSATSVSIQAHWPFVAICLSGVLGAAALIWPERKLVKLDSNGIA